MTPGPNYLLKKAARLLLSCLLALAAARTASAENMAIAIGLNSVDPESYAGWNGPLQACENDAKDMAHIAETQGYSAKVLLTKRATLKNVRDSIIAASQVLKSGDHLVISFSGHGNQVPDTNGDETDDGLDETWCLYDGEMVDDELALLWQRFAKGVRITVYSDSCHSGSVIKTFEKENPSTVSEFKIVPSDVALKLRTLPGHFDLDKGLPAETSTRSNTSASVILISGCQDDQLSRDGVKNSVFTAHVLTAWNNGAFKASLPKFYETIRATMPPKQQPNYDRTGQLNAVFEAERPWTR
jgi:hypothetical protein